MKKFFATIIAVMTVASMFTGCGAAALKDGTYKAKMSEESHGWIDYVEVTVSDGKISYNRVVRLLLQYYRKNID